VSNSTGFYPRLQVDTTNSGAVGQGGGVLLTETIAAAGLGPAMSAALSGWRKPLAVHDPAKVVADLAVTLALGGDCLADIASQRTGPVWTGGLGCDGLADDHRLAADAPAVLGAIDTARAAGRARAVESGLRDPLPVRATVPRLLTALSTPRRRWHLLLL
jgi:hypothetical protein